MGKQQFGLAKVVISMKVVAVLWHNANLDWYQLPINIADLRISRPFNSICVPMQARPKTSRIPL